MPSVHAPLPDELTAQLRHLWQERSRKAKPPQYSEQEILEVLRAALEGSAIKDLCRRYAITDSTFYRWRARYAHRLGTMSLPVSDVQRLRRAEAENRRLRRRLADLEQLSA